MSTSTNEIKIDFKSADDIEKFLDEHPELDNEKGRRVLASARASEAARKNWGGGRKGAGRPTKGGEKASVNIGYKVTPSVEKEIIQHQIEGESLNQTARRIMMLGLEFLSKKETV